VPVLANEGKRGATVGTVKGEVVAEKVLELSVDPNGDAVGDPNGELVAVKGVFVN